MSENHLMKQIETQLSSKDTRLFRNNTGLGWTGNFTKLNTGAILIDNPRPLHAGLCKGSSDLIGFTRVKITQDMVGKTIGVFTAIEVKDTKGKITSEQKNFIDVVRVFGGYGGVARSIEQAKEIIKQ